jgi:hypothetical protein
MNCELELGRRTDMFDQRSMRLRGILLLAGLSFVFSCQTTLPVVDETSHHTTVAGSAGGGAAGSPAGSTKPTPAPINEDKNQVVARAVANIAPFGSGTVMATAKFEQSADGGLSGSFNVSSCASGTLHFFIQEGGGCGSEAEIGGDWEQDDDGALAHCDSSGTGFGITTHIAQPTLPSDWSIGMPSQTDIVGHALVASYSHELDRISGKIEIVGCGVIQRAPL